MKTNKQGVESMEKKQARCDNDEKKTSKVWNQWKKNKPGVKTIRKNKQCVKSMEKKQARCENN
jgi:hypothetical protein